MSAKNPWIELEISSKAVQAHLDHGDRVGSCADAAQDPEFTSQTVSLIHDDHAINDPLCDGVTSTCRPVSIVSADKLRDYVDGPAEVCVLSGLRLFSYPSQPIFRHRRLRSSEIF
jgi:hypothetical protein